MEDLYLKLRVELATENMKFIKLKGLIQTIPSVKPIKLSLFSSVTTKMKKLFSTKEGKIIDKDEQFNRIKGNKLIAYNDDQLTERLL
jgi:hypothetical protein